MRLGLDPFEKVLDFLVCPRWNSMFAPPESLHQRFVLRKLFQPFLYPLCRCHWVRLLVHCCLCLQYSCGLRRCQYLVFRFRCRLCLVPLLQWLQRVSGAFSRWGLLLPAEQPAASSACVAASSAPARVFTSSVVSISPSSSFCTIASAAADFVLGYSASAPRTWKAKDGRTLKEIEDNATVD